MLVVRRGRARPRLDASPQSAVYAAVQAVTHFLKLFLSGARFTHRRSWDRQLNGMENRYDRARFR